MALTMRTLTLTVLLQVGALAFGSLAMAQSTPVPPRGMAPTWTFRAAGPRGARRRRGDHRPRLSPPAGLFPHHRAAGTIIISTKDRFLYLVEGKQPRAALRHRRRARRLHLAGPGQRRAQAEWPDWTPPAEMIQRQPYLPRFMAGGPGNPMGARALYLGGTVYRIHGTTSPRPSAMRCPPAASAS